MADDTLTMETSVEADIDPGDEEKNSGEQSLRVPARSWGIPEDEQMRRLLAMVFAEQDADARVTRTEMFALLKTGGYDQVEVGYDGYGDSGQVQWMTFYKAGAEVPTDAVPEDDRAAVENYLYANLPVGWETDTGCYGTARVYPASEYTAFDYTERAERFALLRDGEPGPEVPDDDR
jgi:hypothetical protein